MKILIVEPGKHPHRAEIPKTLEAMQEVVGGYLQAIYPFDDPVALVCDEEGMLKGYKLNRHIAPDVTIAGTFFICGLADDDFADLPETLMVKYEQRLYPIQVFFRFPN